jgi:hypothetical protein
MPLFKRAGQVNWNSVLTGAAGLALAGLVAGSIKLMSLSGPVALLMLPVVIFAIVLVVKRPLYTLHAALVAGFFATGMSRYISAPTGLMIDFILATGLIIALFSKPPDSSSVSRSLPAVFSLWMLLTVMELFNPQGSHLLAWFYAMRGVALYPLLIVWIGYLLEPDRAFLRTFMHLWAGLSVAGTLWGIKQLVFGLDPFEQQWLNVPGNLSTHMLFGKLRVFSFFSDSGQFGAAQGHMSLVAAIMASGPFSKRGKMIWAIIAVLSLYGLLISGTRGAMAVPAIGGIAYIILSKNWKILILGALVMGATYSTLRFTYVGQDVYEIRRMRTAVVEGSENASLQVRKENQRRLSAYLDGKPFGGGVGSAGYWGQRFSPGTFLANLALDSWYVKIWAEYGIVGLVFYLVLLFLLIGMAYRTVQLESDPAHRQVLLALFCGFLGILVASYGNQVLGQIPTGVIIPVCLIYLHVKPTSGNA